MFTHAYNPSTGMGVWKKGTRSQRHPWLCRMFGAILGYRRLSQDQQQTNSSRTLTPHARGFIASTNKNISTLSDSRVVGTHRCTGQWFQKRQRSSCFHGVDSILTWKLQRYPCAGRRTVNILEIHLCVFGFSRQCFSMYLWSLS